MKQVKDHFKFSTSILRRLGEELSPSPDQGIIELVRNAYDADARTCTIEVTNASQPGGTLRITDDGDGMDVEEIKYGWLVLGQSTKSQRKLTRLGRRIVGDKGLGRLAALRLGSCAKLVSRPKSMPMFQCELAIDWRRYEKVAVVEEVDLDVLIKPRAVRSSGTEIIIEDLGTRLSKKDMERLARSLVLLADPFDNPTGFCAVLNAPEFKQVQQIVQRKFFDDADFHLAADLDEKGKAEASVTDWKGKCLWEGNHQDLRKSGKPYDAPPARLELWAFILDKRSLTGRSASLEDLRPWLQTVGGVHFYYRGLRVYPYGDKGHDWLDMNLRRAQTPELRPSTNTSVGRISVADPDGRLVQKTDRTGFIEAGAFDELRSFAQEAMEWMATCRLAQREQKRIAGRTAVAKSVSKIRKDVNDAVKELPPEYSDKLLPLLKRYNDSISHQTRVLREEVQLYRTLSTVGTTFAVFAHEVESPFTRIMKLAAGIERRGREEFPGKYELHLSDRVRQIANSAEALVAFPRLAMQLLDRDKRKTQKLDLHTSVSEVLDMFKPFLLEYKVQADPEYVDRDLVISASRAAIHSIVVNLLTNALNALTQSQNTEQERKVVFRTEVSGKRAVLRVLDNGPGIRGLTPEEIWLPGKTTMPNGTGLGLTIVRDAVSDLGGKTYAIANGELGGAEICVELPITEGDL